MILDQQLITSKGRLYGTTSYKAMGKKKKIVVDITKIICVLKYKLNLSERTFFSEHHNCTCKSFFSLNSCLQTINLTLQMKKVKDPFILFICHSSHKATLLQHKTQLADNVKMQFHIFYIQVWLQQQYYFFFLWIPYISTTWTKGSWVFAPS